MALLARIDPRIDHEPTTIPTNVEYSGPGQPESIPRDVGFVDGLEDWRNVRGRAVAEHEVSDEELVGKQVEVSVTLWRVHCRSVVSCPYRRQVGKPVIKDVRLKPRTTIVLGRYLKRGKWEYEYRVDFPAFREGRKLFGSKSAVYKFMMGNWG